MDLARLKLRLGLHLKSAYLSGKHPEHSFSLGGVTSANAVEIRLALLRFWQVRYDRLDRVRLLRRYLPVITIRMNLNVFTASIRTRLSQCLENAKQHLQNQHLPIHHIEPRALNS